MNDDVPVPLHSALAARDWARAWELAWRCYHHRVVKFLVRNEIAAGDVDEVAGHVFARVYDRLPDFRGDRFESWIFRLARYEVRTWRKKQTRELQRRAWLADLLGVREADRIRANMRTDTEVATIVEEARAALGNLISQRIFDFMGAEMTDREIAGILERETGLSLSESALRKRRVRVRDEVLSFLRYRGWLR
ncbi:MAG: RNA polymerase sigma factor [Myxococcota bacterium]